MAETWRGFYPITAFVRDALRRKAESGPAGAFSQCEDVLHTACEFWSAVNTGALAGWLAPDPIVQLLRALGAFDRLGAVRIASTLRVAAARLGSQQRPAELAQTAALLEAALARTDDPVDELIARYALDQPPSAAQGVTLQPVAR